MKSIFFNADQYWKPLKHTSSVVRGPKYQVDGQNSCFSYHNIKNGWLCAIPTWDGLNTLKCISIDRYTKLNRKQNIGSLIIIKQIRNSALIYQNMWIWYTIKFRALGMGQLLVNLLPFKGDNVFFCVFFLNFLANILWTKNHNNFHWWNVPFFSQITLVYNHILVYYICLCINAPLHLISISTNFQLLMLSFTKLVNLVCKTVHLNVTI